MTLIYKIYYPITIILILLTLNASLIYSIINLHGTSFPHILNDKVCNKIEEYYIGIYVSIVLFILSLLNNCNCCDENISKLFSFITPYIYFILVIVSNIYIYIHYDCISEYNNTKFINVIKCINYSASIIIIFMKLSFFASQLNNCSSNDECCGLCYNENNHINETTSLV